MIKKNMWEKRAADQQKIEQLERSLANPHLDKRTRMKAMKKVEVTKPTLTVFP